MVEKSGAPEETQKMVVGMATRFTQTMSPEQKLAWSQAQTYLALGNALNGAKSLGFDSCPMGGFDPKEFSRILKIPPPLVPTMLCRWGTRLTNRCRKSGLQKRILYSETGETVSFFAEFNTYKVVGYGVECSAAPPGASQSGRRGMES